jgi:predicted transcriptional regulator of viral defense system
MILKYQKLVESGLTVFDRRTIANILGLRYASTTPVLNRLVKKGVLVRVKRDCYVLREALSKSTRKIANELVKPSYVSLWTALNDAGCTTQVPWIVQSVTPKRSQTIDTQKGPAFIYQRLPEKLFFGWELDDGSVLRATPEKALLDLLYVQKSGIDEESIIRQRFDWESLTKMAKRYPLRVQRTIHHLFQSPS